MPIVYPHCVQIDASNQPTAAQNYEHGTTATTGMVAPAAALTDGYKVLLLAEEVDGDGNRAGAWEVCRATWTDSATDSFGSRSLVASSSGSLIDWSAAGVNATPRLTVLGEGDDDRRIAGHDRVATAVTGVLQTVWPVTDPTPSGSLVMTANRAYLWPMLLMAAVDCTALRAYLSTADTGQNIRLALYEHDPVTGSPGALLADSGNISTTTTGYVTGSVSARIRPGWLWGWVGADTSVAAIWRGTPPFYGALGKRTGTPYWSTHIYGTYTHGAPPSSDPLSSLTSIVRADTTGAAWVPCMGLDY